MEGEGEGERDNEMGEWNTAGHRGKHRAAPISQYCAQAPTSIGAPPALPRAVKTFNGAAETKPKEFIVVKIHNDQKSVFTWAWVKTIRRHLIFVKHDNGLVIVSFQKVGDSIRVVDEACHRFPRCHRGFKADDVCDVGLVDLNLRSNAVNKAGNTNAGEFGGITRAQAIFGIVDASRINPEISIRIIVTYP